MFYEVRYLFLYRYTGICLNFHFGVKIVICPFGSHFPPSLFPTVINVFVPPGDKMLRFFFLLFLPPPSSYLVGENKKGGKNSKVIPSRGKETFFCYVCPKMFRKSC